MPFSAAPIESLIKSDTFLKQETHNTWKSLSSTFDRYFFWWWSAVDAMVKAWMAAFGHRSDTSPYMCCRLVVGVLSSWSPGYGLTAACGRSLVRQDWGNNCSYPFIYSGILGLRFCHSHVVTCTQNSTLHSNFRSLSHNNKSFSIVASVLRHDYRSTKLITKCQNNQQDLKFGMLTHWKLIAYQYSHKCQKPVFSRSIFWLIVCFEKWVVNTCWFDMFLLCAHQLSGCILFGSMTIFTNKIYQRQTAPSIALTRRILVRNQHSILRCFAIDNQTRSQL